MKKAFTFAAILFIFSIFLPVIGLGAFENIKPYGHLYMFLGYNYQKTYTDTEQNENDNDLIYNINEKSDLGFNFKYSQYRGVFELGIGDVEDSQKVTIRKAYGEYTFGSAKLLVGQNWSPYTEGGFSNEAANYYQSKGFGAMYEDPTLQIKLSIAGLYINIMKPYVPVREYSIRTDVDNPGSDSSNTEFTLETVQREITTKQKLKNVSAIFPKLGIGYSYGEKDKTVYFNIGAAGNAYKIEPGDDVEYNKDWIMSYLAYMNCEININKKIYFKISGGYAVNPANFGIYVQSAGNDTYAGGAAPAIFNYATGKYEIKDTWNVQGYAQFGFKLLDGVIIYAGYGYSIVKYPVENTEMDHAMQYFANVEMKIGDNISLTPSFSFHDYQKDMSDKQEGYDIYAGILATVSF